jgi:outer membrane protein assembly factor BamD
MITRLHSILILLGAAVILAGLPSCAGTEESAQKNSSEQRYKEGRAALADEDYTKAKELFNLIVTQDPASDVADDAQYYLGEAYFGNEEYRLAAFAYNRLRQSFPSSPYYKDAFFRASESYYMGSLPADRDQKETKYAIDQFRAFLQYYPQDSLSVTAKARLVELRSRLAKKDFLIAEQYMDLDDYRAALVYYDRVIAEYPDTDYYEQATIGKIRALGELNRKSEALETIDKFKAERPASTRINQIQELRLEIGR